MSGNKKTSWFDEPSSKTELRALRERVQTWEQTLDAKTHPHLAQTLRTLLLEMNEALQKKWGFEWGFDERVADNLLSRAAKLQPLMRALEELLSGRQERERELVAFEETLALAPWLRPSFQPLCDGLRRVLGGLGCRAAQDNEVQQDRQRLEQVGQALALAGQALAASQQAHHLVRKTEGLPRALGLDSDLRVMLKDLAAIPLDQATDLPLCVGALLRWNEALRAGLEELEQESRAMRQHKPEGLLYINERMEALQHWAEELGRPARLWQELDLRVSRANEPKNWRNPRAGDEDLEDLRRQVDQRLNTLLEEARAEREALASALQADRLRFEEVCGTSSAITLMQEELATQVRRIDSPSAHVTWTYRFDKAQRTFYDLLRSRQGELERRREELVEDCDGQIRAIELMPLGEAVREDLARLRKERQDLGQPVTEARDLLAALGGLKAASGALQALRARAEAEAQALAEAQRRIASRHALLHRLARARGVEVADLGPRIEALGTVADLTTGPPTLDGATQATQELDQELAREEARFVAACHQRFHALQGAGEQMTDLLFRIRGQMPEAEALPEGGFRRPTEAEAMLRSIQDRTAQLESQLLAALPDIEARRSTILRDLRTQTWDGQPPELVERWHDLQARLSEPADPQGASLLERAAERQALVEDGQALLDARLKDRGLALELRRTLRQGLAWLERENLRPFCPELVLRVSDLCNGPPEEPSDWKALLVQLREAQTLLGSVKAHALAAASCQVEREVATLQALLADGTPDPSLLDRARSLLSRLGPEEERCFPDVTLRRALQQLCALVARRP